MQPSLYVMLVCIFAGLFLGSYLSRKEEKIERYFGAPLLFGLMGTVFAFMILTIGNYVLPTKWSEEHQSVKLIGMKDQNSFYGKFFLGSGEISGVPSYTYYYEYDGGFKRASLGLNDLKGSKSDIILFEEDRKDGEIKIFKLEYAEEWYKFFGAEPASRKYEFHIPKGSITRGFEIK